ncbi:hypothetical protein DAI22_12g188950 [Oryza sativa Japonica Group]|nr:hypothetical protein DAI22_12g188950 [Oryza sativa Japonica Group]
MGWAKFDQPAEAAGGPTLTMSGRSKKKERNKNSGSTVTPACIQHVVFMCPCPRKHTVGYS